MMLLFLICLKDPARTHPIDANLDMTAALQPSDDELAGEGGPGHPFPPHCDNVCLIWCSVEGVRVFEFFLFRRGNEFYFIFWPCDFVLYGRRFTD